MATAAEKMANNLNFSAFVAGIIALSICESPFISEIFGIKILNITQIIL